MTTSSSTVHTETKKGRIALKKKMEDREREGRERERFEGKEQTTGGKSASPYGVFTMQKQKGNKQSK